MRLEGKTALVTGGAGGMGRALVDGLLASGARVAVFDRDADGLANLATERREVFTRKVDLTDPSEVAAAVAAMSSDRGAATILVNSAGLIFSAPLLRFSPGGLDPHPLEEWDRVVRANLYSVFYTTREVAGWMVRERIKGLILNVGSISAAGNAGQSAYSAAKAGVGALTATWAKELGPLGIRVAGLSPGFFDSEATRRAMADGALADLRRRVPLGRLGELDEWVRAVLALIDNDFFHGRMFELDGGLVL